MKQKPLHRVLEEHREELMALPGVVGAAIGQTDNQDCILVFVDKNSTDRTTSLPKQIQGYPVKVQLTGEFRAR